MAGAWTKLTITGKVCDLDDITAVMSMLSTGLMIEDYSDFSLNGMYGELVDEEILNADRDTVKVSLFVPEDRHVGEYTSYITERFLALNIEASYACEALSEDDWADSWKKYYKPIPLGKVTVVPAWEEYEAKEGEVVIRMDPGMAFGTGTHETTRLVMEMMQEECLEDKLVLDVGTGSGILALCASKLGARAAYAYDIDPVAVRVARENIEKDGAKNVFCDVSDLLSNVDTTNGRFDFVLANIVSDIILLLLPDLGNYMADGGRVILSGIIGERADDIRRAAREHGFTVIREACERDWYAILAQKN